MNPKRRGNGCLGASAVTDGVVVCSAGPGSGYQTVCRYAAID